MKKSVRILFLIGFISFGALHATCQENKPCAPAASEQVKTDFELWDESFDGGFIDIEYEEPSRCTQIMQEVGGTIYLKWLALQEYMASYWASQPKK